MTDTRHPDEPDGRDEKPGDVSDSAQPETGTDSQEATTTADSGIDANEAGQDEAGQDEAGQDEAGQDEAAAGGVPTTDNAAEHKAEVDSDAKAKKAGRTQGLLVGLGIGAVAVIVVLVLAVFVWPGYPGSPDSKASEVTAAWGSKKPADLEAVSCDGPAGKMAQYPPQMMNMVQQVKRSGPVQRQLDTEATMPIDLTVSAQGQTQTLPANVILGVTDGDWCMKGLQPRK